MPEGLAGKICIGKVKAILINLRTSHASLKNRLIGMSHHASSGYDLGELWLNSLTHSIVSSVLCLISLTLSPCFLFLSFISKSCCPAGQRCLCCMASGQGGQLGVGASGSSALAKPLYLQRLERTLRLDSFLRQTSAVFNRDITRYTHIKEGVC